jgi:hypothetical protein
MVMTREERRSYWSERLAEQAASGLSVRAWCLGEGVSYATFNYWRGRLKAERAVKPLTLIRLNDGEPAHSAFWVSVGEARIEVRPDFDAALLRRVVAALSCRC